MTAMTVYPRFLGVRGLVCELSQIHSVFLPTHVLLLLFFSITPYFYYSFSHTQVLSLLRRIRMPAPLIASLASDDMQAEP